MVGMTVLGDVRGRHALITVGGPVGVLVTRRKGQASLGTVVCQTEEEAKAFVSDWLAQQARLV